LLKKGLARDCYLTFIFAVDFGVKKAIRPIFLCYTESKMPPQTTKYFTLAAIAGAKETQLWLAARRNKNQGYGYGYV
jgi:hypothetical protein